jgi:hypothetical protein
MASGYPRAVIFPPSSRGMRTCRAGGVIGSPALTSPWKWARAVASRAVIVTRTPG